MGDYDRRVDQSLLLKMFTTFFKHFKRSVILLFDYLETDSEIDKNEHIRFSPCLHIIGEKLYFFLIENV